MKIPRKDFIIVFLITAVMICTTVYPYIRIKNQPKEKLSFTPHYKKFILYLEDTVGTVDWNETVDTVYKDNYGITYVKYKAQKY